MIYLVQSMVKSKLAEFLLPVFINTGYNRFGIGFGQVANYSCS